MTEYYYIPESNEPEDSHELTDINTSDYTIDYWFTNIKRYLVDVIGMNDKQLKKEFDTRFPELLVNNLDL